MVLFWNFSWGCMLLGCLLSWWTLFQMLQLLWQGLFWLNRSPTSAISQYIFRIPWVEKQFAANLPLNRTHHLSICFFPQLLILLTLFFLTSHKNFLKKHPKLHVLWSFRFIVYRAGVWYIASNWNHARPCDIFYVTFVVDALIFEGLRCTGDGRCVRDAILMAKFYDVFFSITLGLLITTFFRFGDCWVSFLNCTLPINWLVNYFNISVLFFFNSFSYWRLLCP